MKIKFKKLDERAKLPTRGSALASGLDIYSIETRTIRPGQVCAIPTGLSIELPPAFEGQVRPRSGLAMKGITVVNAPGTIDEDYRGEVKVILGNVGPKAVLISEGDRIAQLVTAPVKRYPAGWAEKLSETERGEKGFGSTGA